MKVLMGKTEYITQYIKNNVRRFELKLSKKNDAELIKHLEQQPNTNKYLKELILQDIKKGGN